jgi:tetratricopeptide (TPR) repeat protein
MAAPKSAAYSQITALLAGGQFERGRAALEGARSVLSAAEYNECLGNAHFYSRDYQQSIPYYEAAMEDVGHDCARYHYLIGVQAERKGSLADAFRRYQAAIEIEPSFPDSYVELGGLLCKVDDYEGALQCFQDALALAPNDTAIHHNLIQVLRVLAQRDPVAYESRYAAAMQGATGATSRDLPTNDHVW